MKSARILVVDDDSAICALLEEFFVEIGHEVRTQTDANSAVETYKSFSPHFVFLDMIMPGKSGIELLQDFLKIDNEAKVIMVSGMHDLGMAKESISLGALDYITKPIDFNFLNVFIQNQMKNLFGADKTL